QLSLRLCHIERTLYDLDTSIERLLAENVLAGFERADRPLDVQGVRQRVVDDFQIVVREELVGAFVRARKLPLRRVRLRACGVAAGDRDDLRSLALPRALEDRL